MAPDPGTESQGVRGSYVTIALIPEPATVTMSGRTVRERFRALRMPFEIKNLRRGEWWLNKIRTGLLLLGVAFSFLLIVERGGVTPAMRVGFGLLCASKQPLSVIGSLGGLSSRFSCTTPPDLWVGLSSTCPILAGRAAVFFYRVGLSLLIVSATVGWLVFLVGYLDSLPLTTSRSPGERIAL
jgi:hypothetical protein